jgi:hypothetical protein
VAGGSWAWVVGGLPGALVWLTFPLWVLLWPKTRRGELTDSPGCTQTRQAASTPGGPLCFASQSCSCRSACDACRRPAFGSACRRRSRGMRSGKRSPCGVLGFAGTSVAYRASAGLPHSFAANPILSRAIVRTSSTSRGRYSGSNHVQRDRGCDGPAQPRAIPAAAGQPGPARSTDPLGRT